MLAVRLRDLSFQLRLLLLAPKIHPAQKVIQPVGRVAQSFLVRHLQKRSRIVFDPQQLAPVVELAGKVDASGLAALPVGRQLARHDLGIQHLVASLHQGQRSGQHQGQKSENCQKGRRCEKLLFHTVPSCRFNSTTVPCPSLLVK